MVKTSKKHYFRFKKQRKSWRFFAHRRGRQAEARKARKTRAFEAPKTTTGRTTSLETMEKHCVFVMRNNEKQRVFGFKTDTKGAPEAAKWREPTRGALFAETLANFGGLKERKTILFAPQRQYFPCKKQCFSRCVPAANGSFENPIKHVPLGHQKAFLGTFPPPKHRKIRAFRKEKM